MSLNLITNRSILYNSLFLSIKTASEYSSLEEMAKDNPRLYEIWIEKYQIKKYGEENRNNNSVYLENAQFHPEFAKIVSIAYGVINPNGNDVEKKFGIITDTDNESLLLNKMMLIFNKTFNESNRNTLVGFDITSFIMPFIIKRLLKNQDLIKDFSLPEIFRVSLTGKPWEQNVVNMKEVWKFGTYHEVSSLEEICIFLNIETKERLNDYRFVSKNLWDENINPTVFKNDMSEIGKDEINSLMELYLKLRLL